ncbi:PAS domain-containing protein [Falsirhodobacter sp. 20TX0035]|uniref:PAS domain-containing protein n=1 Tax=Falsirhodobacter sp. 20TX0035 TaxID=3022019 RepID=UPI00232DC9F3|nr:PAS domain-containing protein [Falsirhodobacter sp. 20TX0035]MDB6452872.1 PAS domain-containing protein [Falsirhodobacter sp. 20TX0035]
MEQQDDWRLTEALPHQLGRGDPFAAAVRATRMPMIVTDPAQDDNPIVFANAAFQRLTGYSREELIGRNCRILQGPKTSRESVNKVRAAVMAGDDVSVDLLNYRKDGSTFWNALYISPVRDEDGTIRYFFASQMDITSRIDAHSRIARQKDEVEQEVRRRTADLEAALEAQTLLLHEVDHRVKNNMTMIGSILRLQLREMNPEGAGQLRATMQRIDALGTVHRRLYQSEDVTRFDIGAFAATLASDFAQASPGVRILTDLRRAEVSVGHASALGLVVNELLTLMFQRQKDLPAPGEVRVSAHGTPAATVLMLEDRGSRSLLDSDSTGPLSRSLIQRLTAQANATVTFDPIEGGQRVTLTIGREE